MEKEKKGIDQLLLECKKSEEGLKNDKTLLSKLTIEELVPLIFWNENSNSMYVCNLEEIYAKTFMDALNNMNIHLAGHPWFQHLRFTFCMVQVSPSIFDYITSSYKYYLKCTVRGALYKELVALNGKFDVVRMMMLSEEKLQKTLMMIFQKMVFDSDSNKYIMVKRRVSEDYEFFRLSPKIESDVPNLISNETKNQ